MIINNTPQLVSAYILGDVLQDGKCKDALIDVAADLMITNKIVLFASAVGHRCENAQS